MKLTQQEKDKIREEYNMDGVYEISINTFPNGEVSYEGLADSICDYWLSKIDSILEERVAEIRSLEQELEKESKRIHKIVTAYLTKLENNAIEEYKATNTGRFQVDIDYDENTSKK
jgi:hypothetical protein